jgi:hypothetical protein
MSVHDRTTVIAESELVPPGETAVTKKEYVAP